jgi:hypothetical protein
MLQIPLERKTMLIRQQARYARNVGLTPLLPLLIFLSLTDNHGTVAKPWFFTVNNIYSRNSYVVGGRRGN